MLPIRHAIELNSKLSLGFGGLLNILLIWLVQAKTPKEMKVYSTILLQVCISDLINLVINDAVQPIALISDGVLMVVSCGLAGKLPYPWNAMSYLFGWLPFAYFAMIGIVVQFTYRYMILCRDQFRDNKHPYLVYFTIVATTALIEVLLWGSFWFLSNPPSDAHVEDPKLLHLLGHDEYYAVNATQLQQQLPSELRLTLRGDSRSFWWILWHMFYLALPIGGYVFVIYSGRSMVKLVHDSLKRTANATKSQLKNAELDRQMTLNLIIQACLPLVSLVGWGLCTCMCVFGRVMNEEWFNMLSSLSATYVQCWVSVFNPLVTILTVMPYRRALVNVVFRSRVGTSSTSC